MRMVLSLNGVLWLACICTCVLCVLHRTTEYAIHPDKTPLYKSPTGVAHALVPNPLRHEALVQLETMVLTPAVREAKPYLADADLSRQWIPDAF